MPNIYTLLLVIYVRSIHYDTTKYFICLFLLVLKLKKIILDLNKLVPKRSPKETAHEKQQKLNYVQVFSACNLIFSSKSGGK